MKKCFAGLEEEEEVGERKKQEGGDFFEEERVSARSAKREGFVGSPVPRSRGLKRESHRQRESSNQTCLVISVLWSSSPA